jgi:hypothetical protein
LAISMIVSGSCLLKAPSRLLLRRPSQKPGALNPINAPAIRAIGLPSAEKTSDRARKASGVPTMQAPQIRRYSLTFRRRSARARLRARLAPKSRCSTTLLKFASASLPEIMSPMFCWLPGDLTLSSLPAA